MANSANQPISAKKVGMASKGRPTTFLARYIKKLETYCALLYFWTFAQCAIWEWANIECNYICLKIVAFNDVLESSLAFGSESQD